MLIDLIFIFTGAVLIILGLALSVNSFSFGPLISFGGVVLLHFSSIANFSISFLLIWAVIVFIIQFFQKILMNKIIYKYRGTVYGQRIASYGLILGVFVFFPFGLIVFPFIFALIAELIEGYSLKKSLKLSFGSFIGFVDGRGMKLIVSLLLGIYFFSEVYKSV